MKREQFEKAKNITNTLDRIDRVMSTTTIIHNNKTTYEHSFKKGNIAGDIAVLAQCDIEKDFLNLLYEKKIELEKKLNEL